ncbi:MAG: DUF4136 domain-containing protein [Leeuwenhoekiella sp.]
MKYVIFLITTAVLISCGSVNVAYDYDEEINFEQYQTYNYMPDMDTGLSQLDLDRLTRATDSVLAKKGFKLAKSPAILINVFSGQYEQRPNSTVGVGVGSGGRGGGISIGGGIPLGGNTLHQTITIDVIDAEQDILIWQAVSDSNRPLGTTPAARDTYFTKIALEIFEKFPPEK